MRVANVITDQKKDKALEKIQGLYSSGKHGKYKQRYLQVNTQI